MPCDTHQESRRRAYPEVDEGDQEPEKGSKENMATRWGTLGANRYLHELFIGKQVRVVTTAALPDQSIQGTLDEITDDAFKLTDSKDRTVFIMRAQVVAIMPASEGNAPGA